MKENTAIKELIKASIEKGEIAGAAVLVRKQGELVCDASYGYADRERGIPVTKNTIFRLASMTKPVTAIGILLLEEEKKLCIDDPVEKYLPSFAGLKAADRLVGFTEYYEADPENPAAPKRKEALLEGIGVTALERPVTLRDLLSHSSGMGQGPFSMSRYEKLVKPGQTLDERVELIASIPLDFQPGTHTGYSAAMGFEVLGKILEVVSGMDFDTFVKERICRPLEIEDLSFQLSKAQKERVARLYERTEDGMRDVSATEPFWQQVSPLENGYYSGSAGLFGTAASYDKLVQMLSAGGKPLLREEIVRKMTAEGTGKHLEMCPGTVWGLGVAVFEEPGKTGRKIGKGTYGWSGAYGTHFYVDKENSLTAVLGVNCSNIGGADSKLSRDLEEAVYKEYGNLA